MGFGHGGFYMFLHEGETCKLRQKEGVEGIDERKRIEEFNYKRL